MQSNRTPSRVPNRMAQSGSLVSVGSASPGALTPYDYKASSPLHVGVGSSRGSMRSSPSKGGTSMRYEIDMLEPKDKKILELQAVAANLEDILSLKGAEIAQLMRYWSLWLVFLSRSLWLLGIGPNRSCSRL
jgi:hypothetical protein